MVARADYHFSGISWRSHHSDGRLRDCPLYLYTVLKEDYSKIVKESFQVSDIAKNKAYKLNIYYKDSELDIPPEYIMNFTEGNFKNCSSEAGASQAIFMDNGNLNVELDFCYG